MLNPFFFTSVKISGYFILGYFAWVVFSRLNNRQIDVGGRIVRFPVSFLFLGWIFLMLSGLLEVSTILLPTFNFFQLPEFTEVLGIILFGIGFVQISFSIPKKAR
jgi:hypothetical protein